MMVGIGELGGKFIDFFFGDIGFGFGGYIWVSCFWSWFFVRVIVVV